MFEPVASSPLSKSSSSTGSSDCGHHRRRQACALCIVFSLLFNVHPALASNLAQPQTTHGPLSGRRASSDQHGEMPAGAGGGGRYIDHHHHHHQASAAGGGDQDDIARAHGDLFQGSMTDEQLATSRIFLKKIFDKYGENGVITFEGFQKMLKNLEIGNKPVLTGEAGQDGAVKPGHTRDHHTSDYDDYQYYDNEEDGHNHEGHDHQGHGHDEGDGHDEGGHGHEGHGHDEESEIHGEQGHGGSHKDSAQRDEHHRHQDSEREVTQTDSPIQKYHRFSNRDQSTISMPPASDLPTETSGGDQGFLANPLKKSQHFDLKTSPVPTERSAHGHSSRSQLLPQSPSTDSGSHAHSPSAAHSRAALHGESSSPSSHSNFKTRRLSSLKPNTPSAASQTKDIPMRAGSRLTRAHAHRDVRESRRDARGPHALRHRAGRNNFRLGSGGASERWQLVSDQFSAERRRTRREAKDSLHTDKTNSGLNQANDKQPLDRHEQCLSSSFLLKLHDLDLEKPLTDNGFLLLCPALLQQIDSHACHLAGSPFPLGLARDQGGQHDGHEHHGGEEHGHHGHSHPNNQSANDDIDTFHVSQISGEVWGYAFLSVLVISMVGLLSVAIVPIMQKVFYNHLLQFLVALAVGTLTGDALLHLIPHALTTSHGEGDVHDHSGDDAHGGSSHMQGVLRGLVALCGVYFFFLMERIMGIVTTWRRKAHKTKVHTKTNQHGSPKLYRTVEEHESEVGAKLSKHSDVVTSCEEIVMVVHPGKDVRHLAEDLHDELHRDCEPEEREQLNHSHGHHHGHSHSGAPPTSIAAVAWMVIMGDGFHNFTDGLAIGAAFASGLSGGISTSVAVFCHELPHEIGDFAVLLRAGMSVKQAIAYNLVSSVLCLFGMIVGVCVGNIGHVSLWVLALAGGMFIYIALVDMLPELTAMEPRKGENPLFHLLLQNMGMLTGAGIMAVIAVYEDKITLPHLKP